MFTGIIEETGILMSVKGGLSGSRLAVKADRVLEDIQKGDSIAVNGVALPHIPLIPAVFMRM